MLKILLTSTNPIKQTAVSQFFNEINKQIILEPKNCDNLMIPTQPVNCSVPCAFKRIELFNDIINNYDMVISIQNDIMRIDDTTQYYDCACTIIRLNNGILGIGYGNKIMCPIKEINLGYPIIFTDNIKGYTTTAGNYFESKKLAEKADNWMQDMANVDRTDQILVALRTAYQALSANQDSNDQLRNIKK